MRLGEGGRGGSRSEEGASGGRPRRKQALRLRGLAFDAGRELGAMEDAGSGAGGSASKTHSRPHCP